MKGREAQVEEWLPPGRDAHVANPPVIDAGIDEKGQGEPPLTVSGASSRSRAVGVFHVV